MRRPGIGGVYVIACSATGKFYIGATSNLRKREQEHWSALKRKCHTNKLLQKDYDCYGIGCFVWLVALRTNNEYHQYVSENGMIEMLRKLAFVYNVRYDRTDPKHYEIIAGAWFNLLQAGIIRYFLPKQPQDAGLELLDAHNGGVCNTIG